MHLLIAFIIGVMIAFLGIMLARFVISPIAGALVVGLGVLMTLGPIPAVVTLVALIALIHYVPAARAAMGLLWGLGIGVLVFGAVTIFPVPVLLAVIMAASAAVMTWRQSLTLVQA